MSTRRRVSFTLVALAALAACGSSPITIQAGDTINDGVIPISQSATYSFTLTHSAGNCHANSFRLQSDASATDWVYPQNSTTATGRDYLVAANWRGAWFDVVPQAPIGSAPLAIPETCAWHMRLTAPSP